MLRLSDVAQLMPNDERKFTGRITDQLGYAQIDLHEPRPAQRIDDLFRADHQIDDARRIEIHIVYSEAGHGFGRGCQEFPIDQPNPIDVGDRPRQAARRKRGD